jgi:tRNA (guanine37-N1)-methyltransferase
MKKNKVSIQFTVVTLFPELIENYLSDALLSKAIQQGRIQVKVVSLREYSELKYRSVDDVPYGGGDGMVFKASVLEKAIESIQNKSLKTQIIYLSPQGKKWNHELAKKMAAEWSHREEAQESTSPSPTSAIILICGRYGGIDQRFIQSFVTEEISIGDYVLSGGELAALVLIESISRYIPGVLGDENSATNDSFENNWLEAPQFTKPQLWNGLNVPSVLASGHHLKIAEWKKYCSILVTYKKRPDLFARFFKSLDISVAQLKAFYQDLTEDDKKSLQLENINFSEMNRGET